MSTETTPRPVQTVQVAARANLRASKTMVLIIRNYQVAAASWVTDRPL